MSDERLYPVSATFLDDANKSIAAAPLSPGQKCVVVVIPIIFDPSRIDDLDYVVECGSSAGRTLKHLIESSLGNEMARVVAETTLSN